MEPIYRFLSKSKSAIPWVPEVRQRSRDRDHGERGSPSGLRIAASLRKNPSTTQGKNANYQTLKIPLSFFHKSFEQHYPTRLLQWCYD